ncbi:MAG: hypothetical protein E6J37_13655, partial [Chloroflexi bacterium]
MFTATATLMLPSTVTGSWPRPRWFDVSMWGRPLDTCMMDVRFREKFQDALAVVKHRRHVVDKIEHRPLDYPKIWRIAQGKAKKPVRFGTCCSQVMALFLDIHTPKYKDKREVVWDMAEAMNKELR